MKRIRIQDRFAKESGAYSTELAEYEFQIDRTVDLFRRIKSTAQAEKVSTVLYATRQVKTKSKEAVSGQSVFDYILDWKPQWKNDEGRKAITDAIRNLEMLGWIQLVQSKSLAGDTENLRD